MASLKLTLENLQNYKKQFNGADHGFGRAPRGPAAHSGWLTETHAFGQNPGQLRMLSYVPVSAPAESPLVVVLHGCTQTAEGYASHVGWRDLADRYGFRLLCPQQAPQNNANGCFNWFLPDDIAREGGECQSIHSMIQFMAGNSSAVYVTGLSAGGAMACAMLAAYPEVFVSGSIIAGLPYAAATDVASAFGAMHQPTTASTKALGDRVRRASDHAGPWPTVTIWHGAADRTVVPANADELCKQWLAVHGLTDTAGHTNGMRTDWRNAADKIVVSRHVIKGMTHGAPVNSRGSDAYGSAAPYVLEVGISSSLVVARDWGIADVVLDGEVLAAEKRHVIPLENVSVSVPEHETQQSSSELRQSKLNASIQTTIHAALKSAGLIRD